MQADFQVESRSYDRLLRGSWRGYRLDTGTQLGDEQPIETGSDCLRLWLPAGTRMNWATRASSLRYNCVQFFWPERWYTLSAFYDNCALVRTYASVVQPATFEADQLSYIDLDLSILVNPDLTYEVLTQAEFEELARILNYDEATRISALLALSTLTNALHLGVGLFALVPRTLNQASFHLASCEQ